MSKVRVLTGITTSGTPHLGNYVGAIRPTVRASRSLGVTLRAWALGLLGLVRRRLPAALELCLAALDGAEEAVAFGSGMAAEAAILTAFMRPGDEIVAPADLYGGTFRILAPGHRRYVVTVDALTGRVSARLADAS